MRSSELRTAHPAKVVDDLYSRLRATTHALEEEVTTAEANKTPRMQTKVLEDELVKVRADIKELLQRRGKKMTAKALTASGNGGKLDYSHLLPEERAVADTILSALLRLQSMGAEAPPLPTAPPALQPSGPLMLLEVLADVGPIVAYEGARLNLMKDDVASIDAATAKVLIANGMARAIGGDET